MGQAAPAGAMTVARRGAAASRSDSDLAVMEPVRG